MTIRAGAARIVVINNGRVVGESIRQFSRDKTIYDPWHYVGLLERKPGGDRGFVAILCAARSHGLAVVEKVCVKAVQEQTMRAGVILNLIARELDQPTPDPVPTPDTSALQHEPMADCGRYDALRAEEEHAAA